MPKLRGDRKGLGRSQVRCLSPLLAQANVNKFVPAMLFDGFLCAIRDRLQLQLSILAQAQQRRLRIDVGQFFSQLFALCQPDGLLIVLVYTI